MSLWKKKKRKENLSSCGAWPTSPLVLRHVRLTSASPSLGCGSRLPVSRTDAACSPSGLLFLLLLLSHNLYVIGWLSSVSSQLGNCFPERLSCHHS